MENYSAITDLIDFEKVNTLLEGFNKTTGFVTAILDLEGNVLSKSGWRQICTQFHRIHPETSQRCTISDTELANKMVEGEKYHFYKCLNGLVDVAVPIVIKGEHIANLFSGQFFFEEPDVSFFKKQAKKYGFDEKHYLEALAKTPVVSKEKVLTAMEFLLDMTQLISDMTYQKLEQMEWNEVIRKSEEKFKSVFESANVGKSITLLTGEINVNQAFCKMLGYTSEELQNKKWQDITPENEIPVIQKIIEPLLKGDKDSARFEKRYICKNGTHIRADVSISILRDKNGKPLHFITTVIDITEHKQAEAALRKSEELYRSLFKNMLNGFAYCKMLFEDGKPIDYIYLAVNDAFVAQTGLRDVVGRKVTEIIPGIRDADPQLFEVLGRVSMTGMPEQSEIFLDALQNWFMLSVYSPAHEHFVAVFDVITERKRAETLLAAERQRLESIIDGTRVGTWEWNIQTGKTIFNEIWASMLGYSLEDLSPVSLETWKKLTHPDDLKKSISILENHFNGKAEFYECEMRMKHKNGDWKWILDRGRVTSFDKNGKPLLMHGTHKDITERKKAEEKLRESESRFRKIYEDGANGMVMAGKDFKFFMANRTFCQMTGYTEEELQQLTFAQITHPDDRDKDILPATKMMRGEIDVYRTEKKYIKKDGENFWAQLTVSPIYNSNGQFLYFVGIIVNVTERKKAEEALLHSHDLMKYIIEHNQSAVAVHDKDLNYIFVSQRYLDDYRLKEKDVIGKHHYEVFPDIPEKWRKVHQKALKGIVSRADEDKFYREDGTLDWTRWECRPWYEADGSIGGMIVYTEVINEQKRKEEEIRKLNQRLEILIDSIQQLSASQSLDAVQEIVAKSARKLIGADGATLVFRENNHCFYVNEDAIQPLWKGKKFPMNSCISGWVIENKKPVVIENVFADERIPKDVYSPTFVKSLAMVPVIINEPIGAIGNYWKETYTPTETEMQLLQTLADAAARSIENINLYAELEERVKKRTEQLQAVNKELETFTYSVSHDLKAPLRGIDGYSKLLLDEYGNKLNEEAGHFIETIRNSTLQMNQLIDDLLSYSRLERSQIKQEEIDIKPFVEYLLAGYTGEFQKIGATIKTELPEKQVIADSTGLSIALRNFIENALKFSTGKTKPVIEIGFEEKSGSWILFVEDNGVGFDMKYHDRIFDIFQRLHRAEDFPGTGIGLAMVAKALQRMGGRTWAESAPGKGSTFFIEIPKSN